jgi:hypothetical protein
MNRFFVISSAVVLVAGIANVANGAIPAGFLTPGDDFESDGIVHVVAAFPPAIASGAVATLTVDVEDCGTFTYTSNTTGALTRSAPNTLWTLNVDISQCQGDGGVLRTHHCDGYGHTFETCDIDGGGLGDRAVTMTLTLANRTGHALCHTDIDGDGTNECDLIEGTLLGDTGVDELYVPAPYWTQDAGGDMTCISRAQGHGARAPQNQGGNSCSSIGL